MQGKEGAPSIDSLDVREVIHLVFGYLDTPASLVRAGLVCKLWHEISEDEVLWKKLFAFYDEFVWRHDGNEEEDEDFVIVGNQQVKKEARKKGEDEEDEGEIKSSHPRRWKARVVAVHMKPGQNRVPLFLLYDTKSASKQKTTTFGEMSREWHKHSGFRQAHHHNYILHHKNHEVWQATTIPHRPRVVSVSTTMSLVDIRYVWKARSLKVLVRSGIPDIFRPAVWAHMTGAREVMKCSSHFYSTILHSMFGSHAPQKFHHVPTFGAPSFSHTHTHHALNEHGTIAAKRILCVLAMSHPDLQYCPILPDLVQLFLRFLTEAESYVATKLLLNRSIALSNARDSSGTHFFPVDKKGNTAYSEVFDQLLKRFVPTVYEAMKVHQYSAGSILFENWFNKLFVGILPMQTVLRIFDVFLMEGIKGIFRVGFGLLKANAPALARADSAQEFLEALTVAVSNRELDDAFFEEAFSLRLPRSVIGKRLAKTIPKLENEHFQNSLGVYYRPKNLQTSSIINEDEFELLWSWLPPGKRIEDPALEFTSSIHGTSLSNLLFMVGKIDRTMFIIRALDGSVFGFYSNSAWSSHSGTGIYFGDRECFVWTLRPHPAKYGWAPTHENDKMQNNVPSRSFISMGAGPPAIELHDGLTVTSYECPTFKSPALGANENIECISVEVFSVG